MGNPPIGCRPGNGFQSPGLARWIRNHDIAAGNQPNRHQGQCCRRDTVRKQIPIAQGPPRQAANPKTAAEAAATGTEIHIVPIWWISTPASESEQRQERNQTGTGQGQSETKTKTKIGTFQAGSWQEACTRPGQLQPQRQGRWRHRKHPVPAGRKPDPILLQAQPDFLRLRGGRRRQPAGQPPDGQARQQPGASPGREQDLRPCLFQGSGGLFPAGIRFLFCQKGGLYC
mmetsp:Transcript_23051/g.63934  ORF Transcript_23051/g.63934 Transcript_23051/m.63934 type:complete len:229 (-) Transcript_23051:1133-1819(-)